MANATCRVAIGLVLVTASLAVLGPASGQLFSPDLVAGEVGTEPAAPEPGTQTTFNVTVDNEGAEDAGAFNVSFLVDGTVVSTEAVDGLAAGASTTVTSAPWQATRGNHTIRAVVDVDDDVTEDDEDNNEATAELVVGADLVPTALRVDPEEPETGDNVTFNATIVNKGSSSTGTSFLVRFLVDNETIGEVETAALGPGENATVDSPSWNATLGEHNVSALVDPAGDVDQADTANDQRNRTFTVTSSGPDLVVTRAWLEPANATADDSVTFHATIRNRGTEDADAFDVRFFLDDATHGEEATVLFGLGANESTNVSSDPWTATNGSHTLGVLADAPDELAGIDQVDESNESNNRRNHTFAIGAELSVVALVWEPDPAFAGKTVSFNATVENRGTANASNVTVTFRLDNTTWLGNHTIDTLGPGERANVTSDVWLATNGTHQINATVDANDTVEEADESNNTLVRTLTVGEAGPNLAIDGVGRPTELRHGQPVTFNATVRNLGDEASDNATVAFTLDGGNLLGTAELPGLGPNESAVVEAETWQATQGLHTLTVEVDTGDDVKETDETDNRFNVTITVLTTDGKLVGPNGTSEPMAQLTVLDVAWSPEPAPGANLTFVATIANEGDADAGSFSVRFLVDGSVHIGDVPLDGLDRGDQRTVEAGPWMATSGQHEVRVVVDLLDAVPEGDEDDNTHLKPLTVPDEGLAAQDRADARLAELEVRSLSVSPQDAKAGDALVARATIENAGQHAAGPFQVRFSLADGTEIGLAPVGGLAPGGTLQLESETFEAEEGSQTLVVRADALNDVVELDEHNNEAAHAFEVAGDDGTLGAPGPGPLALLAVLALAAVAGRWVGEWR